MTDFGPLVTAEWLNGHLDQVRLVDVRWYPDGRSGRAAYDTGHLPGAVHLDIDADLSAPAGPGTGRHPLPDPAAFAAALGRAGIDDGQPVVAYDDARGSIAARLWWLLHVHGEPVAVLDGGIEAWRAAGGTLDAEPARFPAVTRTVRPWPAHRFADADQVAAALASGSAAVLDARAAVRYADGDPALDPRPGHIPGARSRPWADNVDPDTGRFRPAADLRARYDDAAGMPVIAYCGSGVTACHDLLALEVAGRSDTALYAGSWSQWGADDRRPARIGEQP